MKTIRNTTRLSRVRHAFNKWLVTALFIGPVLCAVLVDDAVAQTGTIEGVVILRSSSGSSALGVNVVIPGTLYGTVTDSNGMFRIGPIRVGSYILKASLSGYEDAEIQLTVAPDSITTVRIDLRKSNVNLNATTNQRDDYIIRIGEQTYPFVAADISDLLRRDPNVEVTRVGGLGSTVSSFATPPYRLRITPLIGYFAPETAFLSYGLQPFGALIPRAWSVSDNELVQEDSRAYRLRTQPSATSSLARFSGAVHGGIATNGSLRSVGLDLDHRRDRTAYDLDVQARASNDFRDGSGLRVESEFKSFEGRFVVSHRLTTFSDLTISTGMAVRDDTDVPDFEEQLSDLWGARASTEYRFRRDDSKLASLAARLEVGHVNENGGLNNPLEQSSHQGQYAALSAEAGMKVGGLLPRGFLRSSYQRVNQLATHSVSDLRLGIGAAKVGDKAEVDVSLWLDHRRGDSDGIRVDKPVASTVSAQISTSVRVRETTHVAATVQSLGIAPTFSEWFGTEFAIVGQFVDVYSGNSQLEAARFNVASAEVGFGSDERYVTVSANAADYRRLIIPFDVFRDEPNEDSTSTRQRSYIATNANSFSVSVRSRLSFSFVAVDANANWSRGTNLSLDAPMLGLNAPRGSIRFLFKAPGNFLVFETTFNAVVMRDREDAKRLQIPTPGSAWLDMALGGTIGKNQFNIGLKNLTGATYRYNNSIRARNLGVPLNEPGRSLHIKMRRSF